MKTRIKISRKVLAIALPLAAAVSSPLLAAPTTVPAKLEMPHSGFIYPTKPQEGKDPFFPNSLRPYVENPDIKTTTPTLTDLVFKGMLPGAKGVLAIINNNTFRAGDVGEVITKNGRRLTIHCVSIDPRANTVTVEANGSSIVLTLSENQ